MTRSQALRLEQLEDRQVPATFGVPWQDPRHLSLSFAPDGTAIAGHQSELFSALNNQFATADWQRTVLRAFQSWAQHANLNFGIRADEGQAFGSAGVVQGDPRFGDIRVGAHDMTSEVLAITIPPGPSLAGTWSGDVLLNSAYTFDGNPYSLLAVMLHEAGHALGLENSNSTDSVMYTRYTTTRTELSSEDISRIQVLYGARVADAYEGAAGNGTLATAASLLQPTGYKGETPLVAFGDITALGDVDYYRLNLPSDGNDDAHDRVITVRLQTAGASLLAPKLTVIGLNGQELATFSSRSITGDTLQARLENLDEGQALYVRVEGAATDAFGVGRYGLSVRFDNTGSTSDAVIDQLLRGPFDGLGANAIDTFFRNSGDTLLNHEEGGNDTLSTATALGTVGTTRFEAVASLGKKEDVDLYRFTAPTSSVLTASAWTTATNGLQPVLRVLTAQGNVVPFTVLVNGSGTSTVQVAQSTAGAEYYLEVRVAGSATNDKGNYLVSAHFGNQAVALTTFADGTLSKTNRNDSTRLYIAETQLFHFVLSAGEQDAGASVRFRIRDSGGNEVYSLLARAGETISGDSVLLRPGAYTVRFEVDNPNGPAISYHLRGSSVSNPIGPVPTDPTLSSQYTSTANPGLYLYPGFSLSYDPSLLAGYVRVGDPTTYPPGFVLPPQLAGHTWLIVTSNPFFWIALTV